MNKPFRPIVIADNIFLFIPEDWNTTEADQGEYAFLNAAGNLELTTIFFAFDKDDSVEPETMLEEMTANFAAPDFAQLADLINPDEYADMPDFRELMAQNFLQPEIVVSPLIKTEKYVARQLQMPYQTLYIALVSGVTNDRAIISCLLFRAEDAEAFAFEQATIEDILQRVAINS